MKAYCCGFLFDGENNVLLVRKNRPAWQAGRLNGIGGKVEPGENPAEAMVREFREETGLAIPLAAWREFCVLSGDNGDFPYAVHFFAATASHTGFRSMTDEEIVQADADGLPPHVLPGLRWLVPLAKDPSVQMARITDVGPGG